jgi:GNAT superfamily N-acetyltransferase
MSLQPHIQLSDPKTLPLDYILYNAAPPVPTYLRIRQKCNLSPKSSSQAIIALPNSWYAISILYVDSSPSPEPEYIGMGRIISDGGWYFHVVDIAVLPEHQRKGIGDFILGTLLKRIVEMAPSGVDEEGREYGPYVNLVADVPGRRLYERWGFVETAPRSVAMERRFGASWPPAEVDEKEKNVDRKTGT